MRYNFDGVKSYDILVQISFDVIKLAFWGEYLYNVKTVGGWLSLVEHHVRDVGVVGPNPIPPTNGIGRLKMYHKTTYCDFDGV